MPVCHRRARFRSPTFHAVTRVERSRTTLHLNGELDIATLPPLTRAVSRAFTAGAPVIVLDLRDLAFVDLVGLRGLEALAQELAEGGRVLTVTNASDPVMRLVRMVGVHHLTITP